MKYIKDRFYNSRKRSHSLGAPALDLFNQWRANCFFLRVVSAKVRQVFETTKHLEKFFSPIDFCLLKARIKQASNQLGKRASKSASQALRSAVVVTDLQSCIGHFRPPFLWSCGCKGTTTFWNHQIFGEVFFSRASPLCLVPIIIYRGTSIAFARTPIIYRSTQIASAETPIIYRST